MRIWAFFSDLCQGDRLSIVAMGLLASACAVEMLWPHRLPTIKTVPGSGEPPDVSVEHGSNTLKPLAAFASIHERPLFGPGLEPAPGASEAIESPQPPTEPALTPAIELELEAVVVARDVRVALLRPEGSEPRKASEGEVVEGWILGRVTPEGVVLLNGNEIRTIELRPAREEPDSRIDAGPGR